MRAVERPKPVCIRTGLSLSSSSEFVFVGADVWRVDFKVVGGCPASPCAVVCYGNSAIVQGSLVQVTCRASLIAHSPACCCHDEVSGVFSSTEHRNRRATRSRLIS